MPNKPNVYSASDYAGISGKNAQFYYGYEQTWCQQCNAETCEYDHETEWCFVASFGGNEIRIPFSKLGGRDMFDCCTNLLLGVGWILAKYQLRRFD